MKWAIPQLSKYRQSGMPVNSDVQLDSVMERNSDIRAIAPVHVEGLATFGSEQMNCHFRVTTTLTLPCARTWEDVIYPIDIDMVEIFRWGDMAGHDEKDNIHPVEGDVIHVDPVLEELILLAIPMQVYKEDAQIMNPKNDHWSIMSEEDLTRQKQNDEKKVDPRLANLAKFFDQTDE